MKTTVTRFTRERGATLIEMVVAVLLLGLAILGVAQHLLVSKLNVYTHNVKAGVIQNLADAIVQYQEMAVGQTNIPVNADLLTHVKDRRIYLEKSGPQNGVYSIRGSVVWKAFPKGKEFLFNETLTLQIPE